MKKGFILVLIIIGFIGYAYNSGSKKRKLADKEKREQLTLDEAIKQASLAMAAKHHALTDWKNNFADQKDAWSNFTDYYSIQVETALTKHPGRPVLLKGELLDILKRNGKYYMVFLGSDMGEGSRYELESSDAQIKDILSKPRDLQEYALIAAITSAQRPTIEIIESKDENIKGVEIDATSDFFVIKGKLIDMLCLDSLPVKHG